MLPCFLASSPDPFALPTQMQTLLAVGMWVLIGAGVIGTVAACVSIWANLRRRPAIEVTFATKNELLASERRTHERVDHALRGIDGALVEMRNQQRAIFSKLDASNAALNKVATEFERALGRIEGRLDQTEGH